jgi:hypothetical protein
MARDFTSVLDMTPDEIERPKPIPPGDYVVTLKSYARDKSAQKETPYIEFSASPVEALENVDEDWLKEALTKGDGSMKKLSDSTIRIRFYDTVDAGYRLKDFLFDDVQLEDDGSSIGQLVEKAINAQVVVSIKHQSRDGNTFINVTGTAPVNLPEKKKARR